MPVTSRSESALRPKKQCTLRSSKMKLGSGEPNLSNLTGYPPPQQAILTYAKEFFVIESFAAGLFWPHQQSRLKAFYNEKAQEALSQGNAKTTILGGSCIYILKILILTISLVQTSQWLWILESMELYYYFSFYLRIYTIADLSNPYLDFQCFFIA